MNARNRLQWQCRRGMLELDWLLQDFMQQGFDQLSDAEQATFERLLTYPDQTLWDYFMGQAVPIDPAIAHVVQQIRHTAVYPH